MARKKRLRLCTFKLPVEDVRKLNALVVRAKRKKLRRVNKTKLVRFALSFIDVKHLPAIARMR